MLYSCNANGSERIQPRKTTLSNHYLRIPKPSLVKSPSTFHRSVAPRVATVSPSKTLKRVRLQEDIDGEEPIHVQRKKRRLSLDLVTSRLSRPYATPTTHIIGTRAWRAGAWARQRFAGGRLLRKAAILNFVAMKKREGLSCGYKRDWRQGGLAASYEKLHQTASRAPWRRDSCASFAPPVSDYDAFDYETEDVEDDENDDENGDEDSEPVHSDFRLLDTSDTEDDFYDTSWSFATPVSTYEPDQKAGDKEINLMMDNESSEEISVAPIKPRALPATPDYLMVVGG